MTLPFSAARLGLAVPAERRPPGPLDALIEPKRVIDTSAPAMAELPPVWSEPRFEERPPAAPAASPAAAESSAPVVPAATPARLAPVERREEYQPEHRTLGRVVAVSGARATIALRTQPGETVKFEAYSIGRLISVDMGASRIVGMIYEMKVEDRADGSQLIVQIELVGEVRDGDDGLVFRRGIATYPWVGATAHRIRNGDLRAVFDLGSRAGVEIGRVTQDESIPATVSIDDMLSKHFAVVGTTGVGKSSAVSLLLRKACEAKPNLRVLVLDPHNEYAHAFRDMSITLDVNTLELPVWLFKFDELVDVIYRGRPAPDAESDLLRELIPLAKSQFAAYANFGSGSLLRKQSDGLLFSLDSPSPYRMLDLLGLLDEMMGKLDPRHDRHHMRVLKGRLESLVTDARYRFMFGKGATEDNLEAVISRIFRLPQDNRPVTVLQLAGLPSEVLNAVVSVLSRLSFEIAMWSPGSFEVLLLCEEAHRYVPQDPKLGFAPTRQAIARIAKEGRKYGCYIGVVTQRPGELDPTILSQCSTVFAMRLGNERDQEIIRSAISDSSASQISFLSAIGNREAIAFGEGVATPMRMKFTLQPDTLLPAAATSASAALAGLRPQLSLRAIVSRMRGQSEPVDL
jgi:hypothetical protein